ncbi:P34-Arc-domain-containing protein [Saccharata proteae CBS 121410]|uniref:Probable endonuclease LCL3 n=1 Tax=Saccharata proteae CBS 121410 TaxID=1314787 RepID=A0A9P4HNX1_9PEZI|nr:P34-Arc-domain-containing protein [Saccharata proteae CBS 121410]
MLLLDYQNVLIESLLRDRFAGPSPASIDQVVSDFDGVTFHISTPEAKTKIVVSISVKCYHELVKYGAQAVLEREYGPYIIEPENGYDFSVQVDLENLPEEQEAKDDLVRRISLLKRNAMAAPFEQAFDEFAALSEEAAKYTSESAPQGVREGGEVRAIHYRDEEAIYIKAGHDRVTVIFSTVFKEETDRIFGKVFLQEFVDARRRAIQNAPQVLFRNDPPLELQGVAGVPTNAKSGEIGYVTFVLFPRHLALQRRYETISHIQTFRDYFHYHIKASKAYIHSRMRRRTADFLQVLRRARPESEEKERKTASGRTFKRTLCATMRWPWSSTPDHDTTTTPLSWTSLADWQQRFRDPANLVPSVLATATALGAVAFYKTYLRRIPTVDHIKPKAFRQRSVFGQVTRVGDADNFHLFHTPGGRLAGWGWMPGRRVPEEKKELRARTIHIRIAGVDAPELAHFGRPEQPFAEEAFQFLTEYIHNRRVRAYIYRRDQYDRVVASVFIRRWLVRKDVGLEMLKRGLATVYEAKSGSEFGVWEEKYREAEAQAKRAKVGMWREPGLLERVLGEKKRVAESPRDYKTRMAALEKNKEGNGNGKGNGKK